MNFFGSNFRNYSGAVFIIGGVSSHGEARAGVVVVKEVIIGDNIEGEFGIFRTKATDASKGTFRASIKRVLSFVFVKVLADSAGFSTHLGKDTLIFDITLVITIFGIPFGISVCIIDAVFSGGPIHVSDIFGGANKR